MEREQIIKALECLVEKYGENGSFNTYVTLCDALSLIKELTEGYESMANSVNEACELIQKLRAKKKELTEEVESLKQCMEHEHASFMETFGEYGEKCDKLAEENERLRRNNLVFAHNVEKVAANYYNLGCTETVRKMKERLMECFNNEVEHLSMYTEAQVIFAIDQIAKEMIENG